MWLSPILLTLEHFQPQVLQQREWALPGPCFDIASPWLRFRKTGPNLQPLKTIFVMTLWNFFFTLNFVILILLLVCTSDCILQADWFFTICFYSHLDQISTSCSAAGSVGNMKLNFANVRVCTMTSCHLTPCLLSEVWINHKAWKKTQHCANHQRVATCNN